ncbi:tyrosine-protein phosphatase non-receptor type 4 [Paragonimus westermani]|uniref:Tyrosine-protein phosphatase non-receptor type 4 n=1 Tax=Paragonimus westermani TaxID=34504 RepID=A0A5J4P1L5_9TREM|nr:tyrosine-protein phosphatase non-receptor type 4 [Paragonimus westermani]
MARPAARAVRHPPNVGLDRIPASCRDVPLNVGKTTPPIWPSVVFRLLCLAPSYIGRTTRRLSDRVREHHPAWLNSGVTKTVSSAIVAHLTDSNHSTTGDFAFRDFTLSHVPADASSTRSTGEIRRITQLQYISWPDHGIPNSPTDLIAFVRRVREKRGNSSAPVVVHCSAGIGRTGVLITVETAMNLMERRQPVRPLELVQHMRAQRALLIQTTSHNGIGREASYNALVYVRTSLGGAHELNNKS